MRYKDSRFHGNDNLRNMGMTIGGGNTGMTN